MTDFPECYQPQTDLNAPARNGAGLGRTLVGFTATVLIFFTLSWSLFDLLAPVLDGAPGDVGPALLELLLIATMGAAVWIVVIVWHRRPGLSLLGAPAQALNDFRRVIRAQAVVLIPVGAVSLAVMSPDALQWNDFARWLLALPFAVGALVLQVSGEELVFRGYLQQQLSARFSDPRIWIGIPSVLFGLGHYAPAMFGDNAVWIALWAMLFGIAMADLTARSGTLGAVIAVHLAVNIWSVLILALPGPLMGLTLVVLRLDPSDTVAIRALLPGEFLSLLISWLAARIALRR